MSTLAQRLTESLAEMPSATQADLARACGVRAPSVNAWFTGETKSLKGTSLVRAANFLNVSKEWLAEGRGHKRPHNVDYNVSPLVKQRAAVPLISWVQAGAWTEAVDNFAPGDADEWWPCPSTHGPNAFALRVRGVSMEPRFKDGAIIFVDPARQADHGSNVVVRLDDEKEATFKQLVIEGDRRFLKPLNPAWPEQLIPINGNATICGVVIGQYIPE